MVCWYFFGIPVFLWYSGISVVFRYFCGIPVFLWYSSQSCDCLEYNQYISTLLKLFHYVFDLLQLDDGSSDNSRSQTPTGDKVGQEDLHRVAFRHVIAHCWREKMRYLAYFSLRYVTDYLLTTPNVQLLLYTNNDQTLVSSLHRLLNCEIGGLDCLVMTTEYRTRVHCIHM